MLGVPPEGRVFKARVGGCPAHGESAQGREPGTLPRA